MKSVGEVLGSLKGEERLAHCEKHGEFMSWLIGGKAWRKCPHCVEEEREREERDQRMKEAAEALAKWNATVEGAGIPDRFRGRGFDNFVADTPAQKQVLEIARKYAHDWPQVRGSGRSLVFLGPPGTGKTHLACAIALHVMRHHQTAVMFRTVAQAVRSVRDTWVKGSEVSESEAVGRLVRPGLLILDEVGVQSGSDWERNVIFDVLNERYLARRPTIMLTNLAQDKLPRFLGERVIDRMREDGGLIVPFLWESRRPRIAGALQSC